jgi:hypothetical protein
MATAPQANYEHLDEIVTRRSNGAPHLVVDNTRRSAISQEPRPYRFDDKAGTLYISASKESIDYLKSTMELGQKRRYEIPLSGPYAFKESIRVWNVRRIVQMPDQNEYLLQFAPAPGIKEPTPIAPSPAHTPIGEAHTPYVEPKRRTLFSIIAEYFSSSS